MISRLGVALALLIAVAADAGPRYDRAEWPHWLDADRDGCDTRAEVLKRDARAANDVTKDGALVVDADCRVTAGVWWDWVTGEVVTDPAEMDVDHAIPLAAMHAYGAAGWSREKRAAYANDLGYRDALIPMLAATNRAKGSKGPSQWVPPNPTAWCRYGTAWAVVSVKWGIRLPAAEREAIGRLVATC
jgi:hypothetical protein